MIHTRTCHIQKHSDTAKRISDTYTLHRLADPIGNIGMWFACRISDGTSDNVLYHSKVAAIRHQHHNEHYFIFVQIVPSNMEICDAEIYLAAVKKIYDARKSLIDRDDSKGGLDIITRLSYEDQMAQMNGTPTNLIVPGRYRN